MKAYKNWSHDMTSAVVYMAAMWRSGSMKILFKKILKFFLCQTGFYSLDVLFINIFFLLT